MPAGVRTALCGRRLALWRRGCARASGFVSTVMRAMLPGTPERTSRKIRAESINYFTDECGIAVTAVWYTLLRHMLVRTSRYLLITFKAVTAATREVDNVSFEKLLRLESFRIRVINILTRGFFIGYLCLSSGRPRCTGFQWDFLESRRALLSTSKCC